MTKKENKSTGLLLSAVDLEEETKEANRSALMPNGVVYYKLLVVVLSLFFFIIKSL
jgi:hypothetical protein